MPQSIGRNAASVDDLIEQAYRQIFFHAFKVDRDAALESQLRSGQIRVRDFVRGLLLSSKFRDDFYRCNSNYRMVDQIIGRVLGRRGWPMRPRPWRAASGKILWPRAVLRSRAWCSTPPP